MGARSRPRATRAARPLALPLLGGIALIASADQALKWLVVERLGGPFSTASLSLGPSWLQLVVVRNDGVAFGLFQGRPLLFTILSLLIFCLAFVVYWRYLPPNSRWCAIGAACFFGGGLGNLIDRLRQGYVIDIISIGWWPVFNLADSAISAGAAMLILYLLLVGEPPLRQPPRDDALLTHLLDHEL